MPSRRSNRWTGVLLLWFVAIVALLPPPVVQDWFGGSTDQLLAVALACLAAAAGLAAPEIGFSCALRWSLAAACLIWAIRIMQPDLVPINVDQRLAEISGVFGLIGFVVLMGPELVRIATWPMMKLVDLVVYPDERFQRPPLDQRLALFYVRRGMWEQAADEYERILSYYPGELQLYEALMSIYTGPLADATAARSLWRRARWKLWRHPRGVHTLKHKLRRLRTHQQEVVLDG